MDSKTRWLTPNNTALYTLGFFDLKKDGPTVIEVPPDVLGMWDDMYMRWIGDIGPAGPDKGKGGMYLLLPPGYDGPVPDGYHVYRSKTYTVWNFMRGYIRTSVKARGRQHQEQPEGLSAGSEGQPARDGVQEHVGRRGLQHHSAQRFQLLREPRRRSSRRSRSTSSIPRPAG